MKKGFFVLIAIIILVFILIGCKPKTETTETPSNGVSSGPGKSVDIEIKVEDKPKTEVKKEPFALKTDKKRYSVGESLSLTFENNFGKDLRVRVGEGLSLLKLEDNSEVNYGATKTGCDCGKQCDPKMNEYDVITGSTFSIPIMFSLSVENCKDGKKVIRDLESGIYKTSVEYLNREEGSWKKVESNIFIVSR